MSLSYPRLMMVVLELRSVLEVRALTVVSQVIALDAKPSLRRDQSENKKQRLRQIRE